MIIGRAAGTGAETEVRRRRQRPVIDVCEPAVNTAVQTEDYHGPAQDWLDGHLYHVPGRVVEQRDRDTVLPVAWQFDTFRVSKTDFPDSATNSESIAILPQGAMFSQIAPAREVSPSP